MVMQVSPALRSKIIIGVVTALLSAAGTSLAHYVLLGKTVSDHSEDISEIKQTIKTTLLTASDLRELIRNESPWAAERGDVIKKLDEISRAIHKLDVDVAVIANRVGK